MANYEESKGKRKQRKRHQDVNKEEIKKKTIWSKHYSTLQLEVRVERKEKHYT
jgi:hypothetical protein